MRYKESHEIHKKRKYTNERDDDALLNLRLHIIRTFAITFSSPRRAHCKTFLLLERMDIFLRMQ